MKQYIFPILLITFNIGAAIMCVACGDNKKAIYWLAAAVLNITVTF